jgi:hypothetical protein
MHFSYFLCPAAADPRPAQRADETDDDHEPDRAMDIDEGRDFADQGPLTDMDMEEDVEILSLLLKHMPLCRNSKQRCLPSLCWQGVLGCASSQVRIMGRSCRYLKSGTWSGLQGS